MTTHDSDDVSPVSESDATYELVAVNKWDADGLWATAFNPVGDEVEVTITKLTPLAAAGYERYSLATLRACWEGAAKLGKAMRVTAYKPSWRHPRTGIVTGMGSLLGIRCDGSSELLEDIRPEWILSIEVTP